MKTLFTLLFSLTFSFIYCQASFTGYLVDKKENKLKDVTVNLYEGNTQLKSDKYSKKFDFNLELEKYYTVEIIKEGYTPKKIAISTIGGDKAAEPFMFVMEMIEEGKLSENFDVEYPSALIHYKNDEGVYNFDVDYAQNVKKEMKLATNKKID
jgi:hypothetical protein